MTSMTYTGKALSEGPVTIRRPGSIPEIIQPYLPDAELVKAVNLALLLERPLLLMGEPGSGKSRLAQAVAYELYHQANPNGTILRDYRDHYQEWHIKSASKAKEGLYEFDAIARLGDAQVAKKDLAKEHYIRLGPMGEAFSRSNAVTGRMVLLIDEIDKADIDFPNDLLNELDKAEFTIAETKTLLKAEVRPIVIITSNREKELPDAFLRRCLFHYIGEFSPGRLRQIVESRFYKDQPEPFDKNLVERALALYCNARTRIRENKLSLGKNASTSEFLDWFEVLKHYQELIFAEDEPSREEMALIQEVYQMSDARVPFPSVLFKDYNTLMKFNELQTSSNTNGST